MKMKTAFLYFSAMLVIGLCIGAASALAAPHRRTPETSYGPLVVHSSRDGGVDWNGFAAAYSITGGTAPALPSQPVRYIMVWLNGEKLYVPAYHGSACVPNCTGKVCGTDGCGGSCGSCTAPATCAADQASCVTDCHQVCINNNQECGLMLNPPAGCVGYNCGGCNVAGGYGCYPIGTCMACSPPAALGAACSTDCSPACASGSCTAGICQ